MTANIFGSTSARSAAAAFEERAQEFDDWRIGDNVGAHVLLTVKGVEKVATKQYGEKDAVRHDVAVYNRKGEVIERATDILTFSAAVVRDLAAYSGQQVFAKVGEYKSKYGRMAPCLEAPDAEFMEAYEASVS